MNLQIPNRRTVLHTAGVVLLVALVVPFVVFAIPQLVGADAGYVVLSDSMSPTINAGDAVIVRDVSPDSVQEGDIITFKRSGADVAQSDPSVTHRVQEIVERDGQRQFKTKGDANEAPDPKLVPAENVQGEVVFTLPYLGYVVTFANSKTGLVFFVILPGLAIGLSEIRALVADVGDSADGERNEFPADAAAGASEEDR